MVVAEREKGKHWYLKGPRRLKAEVSAVTRKTGGGHRPNVFVKGIFGERLLRLSRTGKHDSKQR